jgi:hypothetical protein
MCLALHYNATYEGSEPLADTQSKDALKESSGELGPQLTHSLGKTVAGTCIGP